MNTVTRFVLATLILVNSALADDIVLAPQKFNHGVTCHGVELAGNRSVDAPALVGQSDWYLVRQLEKYKSGNLGAAAGDISGAQMRAATGILMDATDIQNVVAYINSLASH